MARGCPPDPRWSDATPPAEESLFAWAVAELPDTVRVVPQVALRVPERGRGTAESEVDLVLVDAAAGITIVEVKGGRISYSASTRRWIQNGRECRDPVEQVQRARRHVRLVLASLPGDVVVRTAWRWAVAFSSSVTDSPGMPVIPVEGAVWDARVQGRLAATYARLVHPLRDGEQPLGDDLADTIVRRLSGRDVVGQAAVISSIDRHERAVHVHSESHRNVLHRFGHHRQVLVTGAAGTGKTTLALHLALTRATAGQRVLLACWNVALAGWLRAALRAQLAAVGSPLADEVTGDLAGRIVVGDLGTLAGAATPAAVAAERGADAVAGYFYDEAPELLTLAASRGPFDVVVLDEAQDLSEAWTVAVAAMQARGGCWFAFADDEQDLFDVDDALVDFLEIRQELRENFRNTPEIAAFVADYGRVATDCVAAAGEPVRFVGCRHDAVRATAQQVADALVDDEAVRDADVAVLHLFHNPARYTTPPNPGVDGARAATNIASFKGMERPVVVLALDVTPERLARGVTEADLRRLVYVGASRARALLVVVGDPEVLSVAGLAGLAARLWAATEGRGPI